MEFDTLNWDDFWQKKLEATMNERTQTAMDAFEVTSAQHRVHAERLLTHLQESFPDVEFAGENWVGSWGIYARTSTQRKLPAKKMDKVQAAAERILENIESKYPLDSLPKERKPGKSRPGCLGMIAWIVVAVGTSVTTLAVVFR